MGLKFSKIHYNKSLWTPNMKRCNQLLLNTKNTQFQKQQVTDNEEQTADDVDDEGVAASGEEEQAMDAKEEGTDEGQTTVDEEQAYDKEEKAKYTDDQVSDSEGQGMEQEGWAAGYTTEEQNADEQTINNEMSFLWILDRNKNKVKHLSQ